VDYPRAGAHYPRSTGEFLAWFGTDEDCLDYLEWLRWPGGFACPHCGHAGGWRLADGRVECGGCSRRTSVTAGTIFDKTRTPLTVWFHACWLFATAKDGVSAQQLQRALEIGSYHTAWAMLHRLRSALVRPGRDRLAGTVEVDETFIGGEEHGLRGGRQRGKKVLAGIAVEISEPKGIGRCRMAVLADASAASLRPFVAGNVEPGSRVITDGWVGYNRLASWGYDHERRDQEAAARRGEDPGALLPAVHRVSSLCKRWLLGTHQGRVDPAHLQAYLNEFAFRFNRRHSRSRGLVFYRVLDLAAGHDPVRYHDILATRKPRSVPPLRRGAGHPPSLDRPAAGRPWRTAEMQLQFPLRLTAYPGPDIHGVRTHWTRGFMAFPGSGTGLLRLAVGDELPGGAGLQAPGRGRESGQHEQQERDDVHAGAVQADASDGEQLGVDQVEHEADADHQRRYPDEVDLAPGRPPRPRAHDGHAEHEEGQPEYCDRDPEHVGLRARGHLGAVHQARFRAAGQRRLGEVSDGQVDRHAQPGQGQHEGGDLQPGCGAALRGLVPDLDRPRPACGRTVPRLITVPGRGAGGLRAAAGLCGSAAGRARVLDRGAAAGPVPGRAAPSAGLSCGPGVAGPA
jgi:transposase-like protein